MTQPRPPIALLTDFGLSDAYVGVMKGVILSRTPAAQFVDITHEVQPQAVLQAAFMLDNTWRFFPEGTVFLTIVDPGVGTSRNRIVVSRAGRFFVGPDNGCLSAAVPDEIRGARSETEDYVPRIAALPTELTSVLIENPQLLAETSSATFEGRDVFAPIAAYLSEGGALEAIGRRPASFQSYQRFRAPAAAAGIRGLVLHIDRFGNLLTDIHGDDLGSITKFRFGAAILPLRHTYGTASGPAAIVGSSGYIEIAVPGGSAARLLEASLGDRVVSI